MKSKARKRLPEPRRLYEPPRGDYTELLMRHVLRAATRCKSPTTANIAAEAGISEECCHQIMSMAHDFGFVEFVPDTVSAPYVGSDGNTYASPRSNRLGRRLPQRC